MKGVRVTAERKRERMKRAFIVWCIEVVAFYLAVFITPGFHVPSHSVLTIVAGAVFASFLAMIRPFVWLLVCPLTIVTLGPLTLGLNALLMWLSTITVGRLGVNVPVDGFAPLLIGAMIVSAVRAFLVLCVNAYGAQRDSYVKRADLHRLEETKKRLEEQVARWKAIAEGWERALKEHQARLRENVQTAERS